MFAALTSVLAKIGISGVESNLATAIRTAVILITVLFSRVFLQEKLTLKAGFGFVCMCMGTMIMAIWI